MVGHRCCASGCFDYPPLRNQWLNHVWVSFRNPAYRYIPFVLGRYADPAAGALRPQSEPAEFFRGGGAWQRCRLFRATEDCLVLGYR